MSDENENLENEEQPTVTLEDLQAQLLALTEEKTKLATNNAKLLDEKNEAKRQKDEAAKALKEKEELSLKEKEDFKTLYSNTDEENKALKAQFEEYKNQIAQRDIDSAAFSLVSSLTKDLKRAELLKKEAKAFMQHTSDGVVYTIGGIEVDKEKVISHLSSEYPFLVDGLGAGGGDSKGSKGVGALTKNFNDMSGAELSALRKENPEAYNRALAQSINRKM